MPLVSEAKEFIEAVADGVKLRVPTQVPFANEPGCVADIMQMSRERALFRGNPAIGSSLGAPVGLNSYPNRV